MSTHSRPRQPGAVALSTEVPGGHLAKMFVNGPLALKREKGRVPVAGSAANSLTTGSETLVVTDRRIRPRSILVPRGLDGREVLFLLAATTSSSSGARSLAKWVRIPGLRKSRKRDCPPPLDAPATMDQVRKTMPDGLPTGV